MSNFAFLKNINKDLYTLAVEAEKLFRDEYFEQCCTQTRRFGENVCKNMLLNFEISQHSFDEMLNFLKDNSQGTVREKEFIDDLYFLKRAGNSSVHSAKVKQDGNVALECMQRSFEVAINYAFKTTSNNSLLKLRFDNELLATGVPTKKSLSEKYSELKKEEKRETTRKKSKQTVKDCKKIVTQKKSMEKVSYPVISIPFWKMALWAFIISNIFFIILFLLYKF